MSDAAHIARALRGKWYGRYGLCFCPAHANTRTPALRVSTGTDGRLLLLCSAGCDFRDVIGALRDLGLVEGPGTGTLTRPDPAEALRRRAAEEAEAVKREAQARSVWQGSRPLPGTPAEAYLRGRGITCALPDTLRFHPDCWHPTARRFPALVARVDGADRLAVHRTYLRAGGIGKADTERPKAMLGTVAGGAVRLSGAPGRLVVAEGIETALSLASGLLRGPAAVWAALSTSGLRGLRLPAVPGHLTVAPDGDEPGKAAAFALAERAHALGWRVDVLAPPDGTDWNDVLRGGGMAA